MCTSGLSLPGLLASKRCLQACKVSAKENLNLVVLEVRFCSARLRPAGFARGHGEWDWAYTWT